jgi:HAD superfamily hydrolase (TIGR01509 family)
MRRSLRDHGRRFRAVLFDTGGTLVDGHDYLAYEEVAEEVGLSADADAIAEAVRWATKEYDRPQPPPEEEYWRTVLARALGGELDLSAARRFADRLRRRARSSRLFSDVRRTLDRLKADRLTLGALSNSRRPVAELRESLERLDILHYFHAVLSSGSEGVSKPDPSFFRRAAARLGVAPSETFYVGDLAFTDARAAAAAGLGSVWLHRDGTGFGEDPPEITSLLELPFCLRSTA